MNFFHDESLSAFTPYFDCIYLTAYMTNVSVRLDQVLSTAYTLKILKSKKARASGPAGPQADLVSRLLI